MASEYLASVLITINAYSLILLGTTLYNLITLSVLCLIVLALIFLYLLRGREITKRSEIIVCVSIIVGINLVPLPLSYNTDLYEVGVGLIGESIGIGYPAVVAKYYFTRGTFRFLPLDHFVINIVSIFLVTAIVFIYLEVIKEYKKVR